MGKTRRGFLHLSATAAALSAVAIPARGARKPAARSPDESAGPGRAQGSAASRLTAAAIRPLAESVLPSELGAAGVARAANAFAAWIAGYREGEELVHPYGSDRISATGPSPAARWADQLGALEDAARSAHQSSFAALKVDARAALVRSALGSVNVPARVPQPIAAPHVALAVIAHFLASADATNLAYERVIDPRKCRPLADSPKEPVPLRRAGRGAGGGR